MRFTTLKCLKPLFWLDDVSHRNAKAPDAGHIQGLQNACIGGYEILVSTVHSCSQAFRSEGGAA